MSIVVSIVLFLIAFALGFVWGRKQKKKMERERSEYELFMKDFWMRNPYIKENP